MSSPLPERPEPPRQRGSALLTFGALALGLVSATVLLALPLGFIVPAMVIGGMIFFVVIGFHYLVWGRWLAAILQEEAEEDVGD